MEKQDLLKVSLHGMNDKMQKMMDSYLKNNCQEIATVVSNNEAHAEIVNIGTGTGVSLLDERLSQSPLKPVIALSTKNISSKKAIYVPKPINVSNLSNALKKVKNILNTANKNVSPSVPISCSTKSFSEKTLGFQSNTKTYQRKKSVNKCTVLGAKKSTTKYKNRRSAVRYSFEPIKMILKKNSVFGFSQNVPVLILNNSSKGAYIYLKKPRRLYGSVVLEVQLDAKTGLTIPARVIRKENNNKYGLYFLKYQHELTEYLINSGQKINF